MSTSATGATSRARRDGPGYRTRTLEADGRGPQAVRVSVQHDEKQDHVDRFAAVERELRKAAPHLLLDVVTAALREQCDVQSVELRLADYGVTTLQVVSEAPLAEPVPIHDSPQGRAFGAQEPFVEPLTTPGPATVHLPVTVRGDRLGVLTVAAPESAARRPGLAGMQQICEALGHEILVAERDTDLYLLARRATRLTLAAEMQWQLLPGRSCSRAEFALGAQLEPAYAIFGDNFDWSVVGRPPHAHRHQRHGQGDRGGPADQPGRQRAAQRPACRSRPRRPGRLADQAVYAQYRGERARLGPAAALRPGNGRGGGRGRGLPADVAARGGAVESLELDAQLPLGMFEETEYVAEHLRVEPGDRLLIASDGVYDSASAAGERYGQRALARSLSAHRLLPSAQVPRRVLRDLRDYRGRGTAGRRRPGGLPGLVRQAVRRRRRARVTGAFGRKCGRPVSIRSTAGVSRRRCPAPRPRCEMP